MWCSLCRTDVSVRTTGHAGGLLCSRCGHDLLSASKPTDAIRHAREILERWNSSDLFERISRTESLDALQTRIDAVRKSDVAEKSLSADLREAASPKSNMRDEDEVFTDELPREDALNEAWAINPLETPIAPRQLQESPGSVPPDTDDGMHAGQQVPIPASPDTGIEVALNGNANPEIPVIDSLNTVADSAAAHSSAVEALKPAIEDEQAEPDQGSADLESKMSMRTIDLVDLTHTDILGMRTVANSRVTSEGITEELQIVMALARSQNADPMSLPEDDTSPQAEIPTDARADGEAANSTDPEKSSRPAFISGIGSDVDLEQSPQIPAETANASEPESAAVPKMNPRIPMRRPLFHRRFQWELPATTSSTGSETVNKKLRVDQPGGHNDLPESAAVQQDASVASTVATDMKMVSNSTEPGRRIRIDGHASVDAVTGTDGRRGRTQTLPKQRFIDDAHDSGLRGPHFEITPPRRSNLTTVIGQFLAYLGVLGLTIGTSMVIYGHFGGYSEYTPTGWLVTTVAQMLLFLGVINLVSGGIEQNSEEVSRRINTLGEQLLRIEQVTADALKGPKLSPRLYDNPTADEEETARETASDIT